MKKSFLLLIILLASCQQSITINSDTLKFDNKIKHIIDALVPDNRDHIVYINAVQQNDTLILMGATDYKILMDSVTKFMSQYPKPYINQVRLLPDEEFKNKIGITRLSVANLRAQPKHAAELVTQTLMGMPLQIFETQNGFYHVKTPEGYYAWVDTAGMSILSDKTYQDWLHKRKVVVTANACTVVQKPEKNALPVSDAVIGDVFATLEVGDQYTKVLYPDGRTGYIASENVLDMQYMDAENTAGDTPDDIIQSAQQFLGIPYLWGGTSSKGLDCSGFTKTVYAEFGYVLPRDASQQVKIGDKVELTDDFEYLQKADLLFFGRMAEGKEKITHVAMYLGDGRIIHATGEVKIESLKKDDPLYNDARRKSLLQVRRVYKRYPKEWMKYFYMQ